MEGQEYGALHGTVVENNPCHDEGFNEMHRNQNFELEDDVFSLTRLCNNQTEPNSTTNKVNRQRSSGFVSDFTSIDEELSPTQQTKTKKQSRNVSCQTDFSMDEESVPQTSPTGSTTFKVNIGGLKLRKFCWKHDNCTGLQSPPARPSTPYSIHSDDETIKGDIEPKRKVTFVKKSCQTCLQDQELKIDLKRRKETIPLRKVPVETTVARVKTCDINIMQNELTRCSNLWTESRTFYLGPDAGKIQRPNTRPRTSRSFSEPIGNLKEAQTNKSTCPYCNGFQFSNQPLTKQQTCSRHSFWVRTMSLASSKAKPVEDTTINRRDWILVQCVTQHPKIPICSNDPEIQLPYREIGQQEMIYCPFTNRSLEYIEDICCQHFSNLSKADTLQSGRRVELLFSPKGPKLRDDKNLIGRSIFYFCFDAPIVRNKCSQCILLENGEDALAIPDFPPTTAGSNKQNNSAKSKSSKQARNIRNAKFGNSSSRPASANMSNASFSSNMDEELRSASRLAAEQAINNSAASLQASNMLAQNAASLVMANRNAFNGSNHPMSKHKRKPVEKKQRKPTSAHQKQIPAEQQKPMKKSVHFNEPINDAISTSTHEEKMIDRRRSSLPPPPKLLLKENEATKSQRKRRESVAIMFSAPPAFKQEKPKAPKQSKPAPVRQYLKPEWSEIKIVVLFKGVEYSNVFPEYKTLQDLYTWTRQQLLQHDVLKPGTEILLVKDNLKFPLKANSANTAVSNLPTTVFICEELGEKTSGGGYGDANSRFDTRFSLPMDIRKLEGLTPIDYLAQFCVVSPTWNAFYKKTFTINDKDRDGKINYKELSRAMERLFVELSFPLMRRTLFLMAFDPAAWDDVTNLQQGWDDSVTSSPKSWHNDLYIDSGTFVSMCALANRIMCIENSIDGYPVASIKQTGTHLEDADFYDIEGKLKESKTEPLTKRLLLYLRRNSG